MQGRLAGLVSQRPHLIGDHGKTTALFARTRGFNGCVQGQQVGLLGNTADHPGRLGDGTGLTGQVADCLVDLGHRAGQGANGRAAGIGHLATLFGQLVGRVGFGRSQLHVVGHFTDGGRHLVHCRGAQVGFCALLQQRCLGAA
ncbi:hypothetical protein D3C81_1345030 [compost metagenome]